MYLWLKEVPTLILIQFSEFFSSVSFTIFSFFLTKAHDLGLAILVYWPVFASLSRKYEHLILYLKLVTFYNQAFYNFLLLTEVKTKIELLLLVHQLFESISWLVYLGAANIQFFKLNLGTSWLHQFESLHPKHWFSLMTKTYTDGLLPVLSSVSGDCIFSVLLYFWSM